MRGFYEYLRNRAINQFARTSCLILATLAMPSKALADDYSIFTSEDWVRVEEKLNSEVDSLAPSMPWFPIYLRADPTINRGWVKGYLGPLVVETLLSNENYQEFNLYVSVTEDNFRKIVSEKDKELNTISELSPKCAVYYFGDLVEAKLADGMFIEDAIILNTAEDEGDFAACLSRTFVRLFGRDEPIYLKEKVTPEVFEKEVLSINLSRYCRYTNLSTEECLREFKK